jgi:microtubule-associated protein-like 6
LKLEYDEQRLIVAVNLNVRPSIWDVASRRMVMVRDLGAKGRSCAYHPDGSQIAIGLAGGGVVILSADSLDTMHTKKDREAGLTLVRFSA